MAGRGDDSEAERRRRRNRPYGRWLDPTGRLYTADSENHRVRVSAAD